MGKGAIKRHDLDALEARFCRGLRRFCEAVRCPLADAAIDGGIGPQRATWPVREQPMQRDSSSLGFQVKETLVKPAKHRVSCTAARERRQGSAQPFQIAGRLSDE